MSCPTRSPTSTWDSRSRRGGSRVGRGAAGAFVTGCGTSSGLTTRPKCELIRTLAEWDRHTAWAEDGAVTAVAWLKHHLRHEEAAQAAAASPTSPASWPSTGASEDGDAGRAPLPRPRRGDRRRVQDSHAGGVGRGDARTSSSWPRPSGFEDLARDLSRVRRRPGAQGRRGALRGAARRPALLQAPATIDGLRLPPRLDGPDHLRDLRRRTRPDHRRPVPPGLGLLPRRPGPRPRRERARRAHPHPPANAPTTP